MKAEFERAKRTVSRCGSLLLVALVLLSSTALGQTNSGAVSFKSPKELVEKYDCGVITLVRQNERDFWTSWPMYIAEGKSLALSGYEIHALLQADDGKAVKIVE